VKRFSSVVLVLVLTSLFSSDAYGLTRVIPKSPDFIIPYAGSGDEITSGVLNGSALLVSETIENQATGISNAEVSSYSLDGTKQWELVIPVESISSSLAIDSQNNIFLLGAAVSSVNQISPPPIITQPLLNPDNVKTDPVISPTNSLTNLVVWKISSAGQLLQTYTAPINEVVSPKTITTSAAEFTISASTSKKYFTVDLDSTGAFGTINYSKAPAELEISKIFKSGTNKLNFFISHKSIIGIPSWKPKKPTPVLVEYSKIRAIKMANSFQGNPIFALFRQSIGVVVGCELTSGFGISIVKPLI
jgi:hypothetical protein